MSQQSASEKQGLVARVAHRCVAHWGRALIA
jgi:hypothetical protein